jgi:hypothetical protein
VFCAPFPSALFVAYSSQIARGMHCSCDADFCSALRCVGHHTIGVLLRNQLYAGIVDVPEYGVRGKRGDFEPLITEELFYRVQAILSGCVPSTAPRKRAHPDFPLRGFVLCESCGRGLTGSCRGL